MWPWQRGKLVVASPVIRDGDVVAVVVTDSPTGSMRSRILRDWLVIFAGELAAMLLAVGAALRLTGWVLRPVRVLDATTHSIASGALKSRVAVAAWTTRTPAPGTVVQRDGGQRRGRAGTAAGLRRRRVAPVAEPARRPDAAHRTARLRTPPGNAEIASVQAEGKRLAQVLDDLLDLALAEHAEADLRITDIGELTAERVAAWAPTAEAKGVRLMGSCPPTTAWADPVTLSSALDAVIDNAVKFTPKDETVQVTVAADGDTSTIVVTDLGPGLTDEELARVGDRFWRSGRHQNVKGSGLGLSISRTLLAAAWRDDLVRAS